MVFLNYGQCSRRKKEIDNGKSNIEHDYLRLLNDILINGTHKQTRNGETISVFGRQIRHNMKDGFPLKIF